MFRNQSRGAPRQRECKECQKPIFIRQEITFKTTCCGQRLCEKCGTFRRSATTGVFGERCCQPPSSPLRNPPVFQERKRVRETESQGAGEICIHCKSHLVCGSELTHFTACCRALLCDPCAEFMWFAEAAFNCCVCNLILMQKPVLGCHLPRDRSEEMQSSVDLSTVDMQHGSE